MSNELPKEPTDPVESGLEYVTTKLVEKGAEHVVGHIPAKIATDIIKTGYGNIIKESVEDTANVLKNLDEETTAHKIAYYAMSPFFVVGNIISRIFDK